MSGKGATHDADGARGHASGINTSVGFCLLSSVFLILRLFLRCMYPFGRDLHFGIEDKLDSTNLRGDQGYIC